MPEKEIKTTPELTAMVDSQQSGTPVQDKNEQNSFKFNSIMDLPYATDEEAASSVATNIAEVLNNKVAAYDTSSHNQFIDAASTGYGTSRLDKRFGFQADKDLEDLRAKEQSFGNKILAGLGKGAVTTLTTAANSTVGLVVGAGTSLFEAVKAATDPNMEFRVKNIIGSGVNNTVSKKLIDIQTAMEEIFPNYRTEEERTDKYQDEWYKHMLTGNFIGDSFIKNFGFTLGAMGAGILTSKALNKLFARKLSADLMKGVVASTENTTAKQELIQMANTIRENGSIVGLDVGKLMKNASSAGKTIRNAQLATQLTGATIAALGEGTVEGLMAQSEFLKDFLPRMQQNFADEINAIDDTLRSKYPQWYKKQITTDQFGRPIETYVLVNEEGKKTKQAAQRELAEKYDTAMHYVEEQGKELATTTCALNLPILMASDLLQFGKAFGGGWQTARRNLPKVSGGLSYDIAGNATAEFTGIGHTGLRAFGNTVKMALSEASEEMAQGYVSSGAKKVADTRLTSYMDSGFDPEALGEAADWLNEMLSGGNSYLSKSANWQEGFIGAITGLLGIPSRHLKSWHGGLPEAIRTARHEVKASQEAADRLNETINSEDFQSRWRGYIRKLKFNNEKEKAVEEDNQYAWHNAHTKDLINDIVMFADAGKLDELDSWVDHLSTLGKQDVDQIRDFLASDSETQALYTQNTPDEVILDKVHEKAKTIKDAIANYRKVYEDLSSVVNPELSSDRLKELVFTGVELRENEDRFHRLLGETMTVIDPILRKSAHQTKDGKITDEEKEVEENLRALQEEYNLAFSGNVRTSVFDFLSEKKLDKRLDSLEKAAEYWDKKDGTNRIDAIRDMRKIAADRRELIRKIASLRTMTDAQFDAMKVTPKKVEEAVETTQTAKETKGYASVNDVRNAIRPLKGRARLNFKNSLRKQRSNNPYIDEFFKIQDLMANLNKLSEDSPNLLSETNADEQVIIRTILQTLGTNAETTKDIFDFDENSPLLPSESDVIDAVTDRATTVAKPEGYYAPLYASAVQKVKELISLADTIGIESGKSTYDNQDILNFSQGNPERGLPEVKIGGTQFSAPKQSSSQQGMPNLSLNTSFGQTASQAAHQTVPAPASESAASGSTALAADKSEPATTNTPAETHPGDVDQTQASAPVPESMSAQEASQAEPSLPSNIAPETTVASSAEEPQPDDRSDEITAGEEAFMKRAPRKDTVGGNDIKTFNSFEEAKEAGMVALSSVQIVYNPISSPEDGGKVQTYYNSAVPECVLNDVSKAQEAIKSGKFTSKDILPPRNLIEASKSSGDRVEGSNYITVWNYLYEHGAFDNMSKLQVGDAIHFVIDPTFKDDNNNTPILMATIDSNNNIQILNILRENAKDWEGLGELRAAINAGFKTGGAKEYANGSFYVFPKTSFVWAMRPGVVTYDNSENFAGERAIKDIEGYDAKAPIIVIRRNSNGEFYPSTLRGTLNAKQRSDIRRSIDKIQSTAGDNDSGIVGRIYYVVKTVSGNYLPVRCNIEHFNLSNYKDGIKNGNPAYLKVKSLAEKLADTFNRYHSKEITRSEATIDVTKIYEDLCDVLDCWDIFFSIGTSKTFGDTLRFTQRDTILSSDKTKLESKLDVSNLAADNVTAESIMRVLASRNLPFQIRINWEANRSGALGETKHLEKEKSVKLNDFVGAGLLTSNATALRERGVDFYINVWDAQNDDFKTEEQEKSLDQKVAENKLATEIAEVKLPEVGAKLASGTRQGSDTGGEFDDASQTDSDLAADSEDVDYSIPSFDDTSDEDVPDFDSAPEYDSLPDSTKTKLKNEKNINTKEAYDQWVSITPQRKVKQFLEC